MRLLSGSDESAQSISGEIKKKRGGRGHANPLYRLAGFEWVEHQAICCDCRNNSKWTAEQSEVVVGKQLLAMKTVKGVRHFIRQAQAKPKDHGDEYYMCDIKICLLYTSPSPRDGLLSRMPSSA